MAEGARVFEMIVSNARASKKEFHTDYTKKGSHGLRGKNVHHRAVAIFVLRQ
jgi:hypothetical protein